MGGMRVTGTCLQGKPGVAGPPGSDGTKGLSVSVCQSCVSLVGT